MSDRAGADSRPLLRAKENGIAAARFVSATLREAGETSFSSSIRIRMDGVRVSSYWPERTAQMKAARNPPATARLARINITITFTRSSVRFHGSIAHDPSEAGAATEDAKSSFRLPAKNQPPDAAHFANNPARFAAYVVAPQANATTVTELTGIKIALTSGENSPPG